jgi:hypothetical protein
LKRLSLGEGRVNWRIIRKSGCGRDGDDDDDDDDDDNILSAVCDGLDPYNSPFLFSYPKYKNLSTTSVYASSSFSFLASDLKAGWCSGMMKGRPWSLSPSH